MPPSSKTCTSSTWSPPTASAPKWKAYFDGFKGREAGDVPHSAVMPRSREAGRPGRQRHGQRRAASTRKPRASRRAVGKLITAYRSRGHLAANLDPLGMTAAPGRPGPGPGLPRPDRRRPGPRVQHRQRRSAAETHASCATCSAMLKATYSRHHRRRVHAHHRRRAAPLDAAAPGRRRPATTACDADDQARILERLTAAEGLERYLHTKYVGQKRFSLEGGDSLIPLLDTLIQRAGSRRRQGRRDRHGPPRPPQRAGQHPGQAAAANCSTNSKASSSTPTTTAHTPAT